MSYSATVLAWGMITFEDGYKIAGEWQNAIDQIKWVTDYLIKCHTGPTEFWGQVCFLTLTRPIDLPPHTPVAQKISD